MDVVVYLDTGPTVYFAHRDDGWVGCHPAHLIAWFERAADAAPQLRRLVKYYKVWVARHPREKMPSGVIAMILMTTLYHGDPRDDIALIRTMIAVQRHLDAGGGCQRPTIPVGEELLPRELDETQVARFLGLLRNFNQIGREALATSNRQIALGRWQELFGPDFGMLEQRVSPEMRAVELRDALQDLSSCGERVVETGGDGWTR
jgi:hypothetical protein